MPINSTSSPSGPGPRDREALEKFSRQVSLNPKDTEARTSGRTMLGLLSPTFKEAVARVMEYGAKKYGAWNWRDQPVALSTYLDATERHIEAIRRGEWIDHNSGCPHAACIGANANVILDATHHGTMVDDLKSKDKGQKWPPALQQSALPSYDCPVTGMKCYQYFTCAHGCFDERSEK